MVILWLFARAKDKEGKREREKERAIGRKREKESEQEMCSINSFSVLLYPFLSFLFNFLYLSYSIERGKLWIEDIHKYFSIPRYIEKGEKHKKTPVTNEETDWHTNINKPYQQISRYDIVIAYYKTLGPRMFTDHKRKPDCRFAAALTCGIWLLLSLTVRSSYVFWV